MIWIAPSEKDTDNAALEKRLWDAADQFRANSGLKSQEYSAPVLGHIFLRFAEVRFAAQRAKLEGHPRPSDGRGVGGEGASHGRFDFVLANPPFNVNAVDKERLRDMVGPGRRFPFGLPRTDNANTSGFNSSTPRSTKRAAPASSWPTPPPTPAPPNRNSAASSSKAAPWT